MSSVVPLVPADVELDPETLAIAGIAFDKARAALAGWERTDLPEEALARQIITLAHGGERDADRLCEKALSVFGLLAVPGGMSAGNPPQLPQSRTGRCDPVPGRNGFAGRTRKGERPFSEGERLPFPKLP